MVLRKKRFGSLLGLLNRRERDSRIFTNAEIIFDYFGNKDTLLLNHLGQTFVSLSGFLEILSKTELSSEYRIEARGGLFHSRFCFTLFLEVIYEGIRYYE